MPTFSCVSGMCACAAPTTTLCAGRCVDLMNDPANCSACGMACPAMETCAAGTCRPFRPVDVTLLLDVTGSNVPNVTAAVSALQTRLVAPLLALAEVNVGVSYTCEFPITPYGSPMDRPFQGATEPITVAATLNSAIAGFPVMGGGDLADGMIEGLAPLAGRPLHPTSLGLTCSMGRVAGGCWRAGARRVIVLFTDDIFHNGPDPAGAGLFSPYVGITPAPATWTDVLAALRADGTLVLFMNSNAAGAASMGAAQYLRMLMDLGQPATDVFLSSGAAATGTASDAVVARIRAIRAM
jgi:hypothetical protein